MDIEAVEVRYSEADCQEKVTPQPRDEIALGTFYLCLDD